MGLYTFIAVLTILTMKEDKLKIHSIANGSAIICITSGIIFGIAAFMTNQRLKNHFRPFYDENRKKLVLSAFGLSLPIILRGINDYLSNSDWHRKMLYKYKAEYEITFFFVSDMIPLAF